MYTNMNKIMRRKTINTIMKEINIKTKATINNDMKVMNIKMRTWTKSMRVTKKKQGAAMYKSTNMITRRKTVNAYIK